MNTGRKSVALALLGVPPLAAAAGLLAATPGGIGIYPDSVLYIEMARSLLQGRGWTMAGTPLEIFPPLYPALLALPGLFGIDPIAGGRWIEVFFWASNVFWAGFLAYEYSGKSLGAAILTSLLTLAAVDLLSYHSVALSDGAFLFFLLPSFLFLNRYLAHQKTGALVTAALLTALAAITRYAGLAAIGGGVVAIVLLAETPLSRRIRHALLFGIVSSLGAVAWMLRNLQYQHAMGRSFDIHSVAGEAELKGIIHACAAWFFQWKVPDAPWMLVLPAVPLLLSILWARSAGEKGGSGGTLPVSLMLIFMAAYASMLVLTAAFFQGDLFRDSSRLFMPLHVLMIVLFVTSGRAWLNTQGGRALRIGALLVSAALSFVVLTTGAGYVRKLSGDGQGYASRAFRESPVMERSKSIQPEITVYTNLRLPIVLYTGRMASLIPLKVDNGTQRPNENYDAEMRRMAADIRDSSAMLVWFNHGGGWFVLPSVDEIRGYVPLRCVAREADGEVYAALGDTESAR